ncbi:hypothetical protein [Microbacterium sp. Leaf320]|uniref:hypothetical protein n=1 Tax=Microbacterium sp. Leaf320 TaxID=1736334 RepID=UPI000701E5F8|nr:hypothetical protein [Microbacterium sp. Leaf320]KQQ66943.1 hypothetical protein ASF63_06755 [Microbacterium sp. Leaf320]
MPRPSISLSAPPAGLMTVSIVAQDERGFTHYYEPIEAPPAAVREAYDLLARAAEQYRVGGPVEAGPA